MCKLKKTSNLDELRTYLEKVINDNARYPINIADVYPLCYSTKAHAVRAIKRDYPDCYLQQDNGAFKDVFITFACFESLFIQKNHLLYEAYRLYNTPKENSLATIQFEEPEPFDGATILPETDKEHISSVEIARFANRNHRDVLRTIRSTEDAWVRQGQRNFAQTTYLDGQQREQPCYLLTKEECLYVSSKFNDDIRAKLVLRWKELEQASLPSTPIQALLQAVQNMAEIEQRTLANEKKMQELESRLSNIEEVRHQQLELFDQNVEEPQEITLRTKINNLVALYSEKVFGDVYGKDCYRQGWRDIYNKFKNHYHHQPQEGKDFTKLDWIERNGYLEDLHKVVAKYLKQLNQ